MGILLEQLLDEIRNLWNPGRTTHKDDFVDLFGIELGIFESLHDRTAASLDQVIAHLLKLGARDRDLQVLGA